MGLTAALYSTGSFPETRLRRLRRFDWLRDLVCETTVLKRDLIWSCFVREEGHEPLISSMPGVKRYTPQELVDRVGLLAEKGLKALALFPAVEKEKKCLRGEEALNPDNLVARSVRLLKRNYPHVGIICDVALDPYTSHGHDGLLAGDDVSNDDTVDVLIKQAVLLAMAGADIVAPSDMMDGRVGAIRRNLDAAGFQDVGIMAYAAKYASAFYGPFREALGSAQCLGQGHKKTYQMNPANIREALREVALDLKEGADLLIVKPGLPYLDVIARVKDHFGVPTFAFHVSGEYAMLKAAAEKGWLDYEKTLLETMVAFKRAGADGIISYAADSLLDLLEA